MKKTTKLLWPLLALLAVGLCVSACDQSDPPNPAETTESIAEITTADDPETEEPVVELLKFSRLPDGTYSVRMNSEVQAEEVEIPAEYNGAPVTEIGSRAFRSHAELKKIHIPDSITVIGEKAFSRCTGLTEITLPASLTEVGEEAFSECTALEGVYISDLAAWCRIRFDGYEAQPLYNGCALYLNSVLLTELTIPEGLTEIGSFLFAGCTSLTSATIPEGVTTVGSNVFNRCENLTDIHIADTVTTMEGGVFSDCTALTTARLPGSLYTLPGGLFHGCTALTSVTLEEGIAIIERWAFYGTSLTEIFFPDSVTSIREGAFQGCTTLKKMSLPRLNELNLSVWRAFEGSPTSVESVEVRSGSEIPKNTFRGCSSLTEVIFRDPLTVIGDYAFAECTSFTSFTIPETVTRVCTGAFMDCSGLTEVHIMEGVTSIGARAFSGCNGLTEMVFPESLTSIGTELFDECYNIRRLTFPYSVQISALYFGGNRNSIESVTITGGTAVAYEGFRLLGSLKEISLPDTITVVEGLAFDHCFVLEELHLPDAVESLGIYAISNCPELTSLTLPKNLTTIGRGAFQNNDKLASMVIHNKVTSIDEEVFLNCYALTDIYYTGTEEEWNAISIKEEGNKILHTVNIHYNYTPEA